jgi:hypothetical protein
MHELQQKWLDSGRQMPIIMSDDGKVWCRTYDPTFDSRWHYAELKPRERVDCGGATFDVFRQKIGASI